MLNLICRVIAHLLILLAPVAEAVEQLEVQGLFSGKAVLLIDGQMRIVAQGMSSPEGVTVVEADSKSALLEIDGKQKRYVLGNRVSTDFAQSASVQEQIMVNRNGMYRSYGSINGHSVNFLVDTGATSIAINSVDAKRLGIQYRLDGEATHVSTASGRAKAWRIKLKSVKLGRLKQSDVEAVVIEGGYPREVLLGMTFLNQLKIQNDGSVMTLEQKK
ncbi:MAG: TIGR02281 family clan AA aspartic protease [Gammaproteobacteria bacterium]|nr:TIGR02281 family clan AA aspartic protease [Gammaproteobacteria bacterium]